MSTTEALLPLGTQVIVSNGTPRPPARFKKKLADWEAHNYRGVVVEHDRLGRYTIQRVPQGGWASRMAGVISFKHAWTNPEWVKPIPGTCLAPVTDAGYVDRDAMIALEQAGGN